MDVLLVIDMQEAMLRGGAKHDLAAVTKRINRLADRVRRSGGRVVFVQHNGPAGDDFAPGTPGWEFLGSIRREPQDLTVRKTLNDAFFDTTLKADLDQLGPERLLVAGWATDLCVDATIRSAASLGYRVTVVSDGHTVSARPHLGAEAVIEHHHWVWTNLLSPYPVVLQPEAEIL